ncbi:MAG: HNH endonuclease [Pseudomonadota bacterium]
METVKVPKGIIRFEQGSTRGWWVRVKREDAHFRKLFSDGVYGSSEAALEKAIEYLKELKEAFPRSRKRFTNVHRRKGSGPIPGVRRVISTRKGHKYASWLASWSPEPGVYKSKRFGVLKHGETGAMRMAIQLRFEELEKIKDTFPDEYELQLKEIPVEYINSGVLAYSPAVWQKREEHWSDLVEEDPFAFEGETNYALHLEIERSKELREKKVAAFFEKHGRIFCEICLVNLKEKYPFIEKDFIEVHHIVPLSQLTGARRNYFDDLMLLCPNCHSAVHQGDAQDNLLDAMIYFEREFS